MQLQMWASRWCERESLLGYNTLRGTAWASESTGAGNLQLLRSILSGGCGARVPTMRGRLRVDQRGGGRAVGGADGRSVEHTTGRG
mmetsp:Transcript_17999/g.35155  ORF Transcript_17999/g.35155 Transcript_17999/m.35155 type:complete len:86 (-) Transcript_17999:303-560(-)